MTELTPIHPYIRALDQIGSHDIALLGGKAARLGILTTAGLPVPKGFCVTTEAYVFFREKQRLPDGLIDSLEVIRNSLGGKIAIRSSATCEDGDALSMAGVFESRYVREDDDIQTAIEHIYLQVGSKEVTTYMALRGIDTDSVQMGLVIQELIDPELSGVVYTGINAEDILVQYIDGFGARLVDGEVSGSAVILSTKSKIIAESVNYELRPLPRVAIEQIVHFAEIIGHIFERGNHDIEFAYRDGEVFILQSRTLTKEIESVNLDESIEETLAVTKHRLHQIADEEKKVIGTARAVFSNSNFSELLPRPTEMDFGVFAYIFTGLDGYPGAIQLGREEMGYSPGKEAIGLINYIGGKPYFSVSRDAATFYAGFPETRKEYFRTLVNEYLDIVQNNPNKGKYPEMELYLQDPTLEDLQVRYGDKAQGYYQVYRTFVTKMDAFANAFKEQLEKTELPNIKHFLENMHKIVIDTFSNTDLIVYINQILEHLRTVSCVDFVKAARLGFYYSQRIQLELKKSLRMADDELTQKISQLLQGLEGSMITDVNLAIADASSMEEALIACNNYTSNMYIGHYSIAEILEIRHPRYKEHSEALKAYIYGIRQTGRYKEDFEKQREERLRVQESLLALLSGEDARILAQVITAAQTYMALRETVKYYFTYEYALIRNALELLQGRLGLERGDIYYLYPKELPVLVNDTWAMSHIIRSRKQAFHNYQYLDLPTVIRESDIDGLSLSLNVENDFTELRGKFLASGEAVQGVIVNLDSFSRLDEAEAVIKQYTKQEIPIILATKQMNLGHDPLIMSAAGLIIENAGIVSHGAQRARELGRGAIGGIKSKYLRTGTKIYFDPSHKIVRKLEYL
jgi:pyruvate,water dikinase